MTTINDWRRKIIEKISPISDTARVDAELLLMHATDLSRTELLLKGNELLSHEHEIILSETLARRTQNEPVAYILGFQPFWTMELLVSEDTLIPRPETECLIDWVLTHFSTNDILNVADLGTGTGAIALSLASEKPRWMIDATDISYEALAIAKKNMDRYGIKNVAFHQGDWLNALPAKKYDLIISNPPYLAHNDPHLAKLTFEPQHALVSGEKGLDAITCIVNQARAFLNKNAYLVLEHGYDQAEAVLNIVKRTGFVEVISHRDLSDIPRFVTGKLT